ncbi:MAG TPA: hypothetical protein VHV10_20375 [Ktedonobacteraceae bacterium]|nr:hypothetical protein [Ktedonobacteraceae bacterium]
MGTPKPTLVSQVMVASAAAVVEMTGTVSPQFKSHYKLLHPVAQRGI